jgi:hypothetical protein
LAVDIPVQTVAGGAAYRQDKKNKVAQRLREIWPSAQQEWGVICNLQISEQTDDSRERKRRTYPALRAKAAGAVDPDVLGHDVALLVQLHVFGQLVK